MIRSSIIGAAIAIAVFLVHPIAASEKPSATSAPEVTFTTATGHAIHTSDLKGHVSLIDFWASWCIPCRKSFPAIDALAHELEKRGLTVIAVNLDEERRNADGFLAKYPHSMTVAFDPHGTIAEAFQVKGMPSSMLIDRSGIIRKVHMGYTDATISQFRSEALELLGESE